MSAIQYRDLFACGSGVEILTNENFEKLVEIGSKCLHEKDKCISLWLMRQIKRANEESKNGTRRSMLNSFLDDCV